MDYRVVSEEEPFEEEMTSVEFASIGQRFGAFLVDLVISMVILFAGLVVGGLFGGGDFAGFVLNTAYLVFVVWLVTTRGQSPGKMAIGIKIIKTDGSSAKLGSVLLREIIGKIVSAIVLLLGFIWILFDDKRQGWHDKIAGTVVVKDRVASEEEPFEEKMTSFELASNAQRFGAFLVDFVIFIVIGSARIVVGRWLIDRGDITIYLYEFSVYVLIIACSIFVVWLVATRGQSPGKMVIGIKIIKTDGSSVKLGSVLLRETIGKIVSWSFSLSLGFIWILFDGERQGWHDKIADTVVVKV